jgi:16S rRNA (cytosine1402-N4)-methyltransferase
MQDAQWLGHTGVCQFSDDVSRLLAIVLSYEYAILRFARIAHRIVNEPLSTPHKRRVRYRGTHPRRFAEKYKEHEPERFPDDVQKIIAGGKTPAGTHRPICLREILDVLKPKPGETAVDATLGYGGHALELLGSIQPGGRLIGLDVDPIEFPKTETRLRAAGIPAESLLLHRINFAGLPRVLADENISGADVVLADLGVSSMQIDNPERGFSFKHDGPLDLRLNPARGRPASALLAAMSEAELAAILQENADEPHSAVLAAAICAARSQKPILTTAALARIIRDNLKANRLANDDVDTSVRRVFQALRIAVNDEFSALETFLRNLPGCLNPKGRAAVLTFHSGEDRRVKKAFAAGERDGVYSRIAREIIRPSPEEIRANPRASSAKLRWAVRA